jgi:hypothetical protein
MQKLSVPSILVVIGLLVVSGCSKKSAPTEPPVSIQPTSITGTVSDTSGAPIVNASVCIKYYFTTVVKSTFSLSKACSLAQFTASRYGSTIRLDWRTAWETNSYQWKIERSPDGVSYVQIATLPTGGNSTTPLDYYFIDSTAPSSSVYYRLCEVDLSSNGTYYGPIGVSPIGISTDAVANPYPNPFTSITRLNYRLADSSLVNIVVRNAGNSIIRSLMASNQAAGIYALTWNGRDDANKYCPSGLYFPHVTYNRHDSVFVFTRVCFLNNYAGDTTRANALTDSQGRFTISSLPIDSTFAATDEMGEPTGTLRVVDSIRVGAAKGSLASPAKTVSLSRNTPNTVNLILH